MSRSVRLRLPGTDFPRQLAELHRSMPVGAAANVMLDVKALDGFPLHLLVEGAGFTGQGKMTNQRDGLIACTLTRLRTLPDTVGVGMGVIIVGLNPSEYAADAGVGFARPGNRFWPAAIAGGLLSCDRDPVHALAAHGVGMSDLVKRATPRADGLTRTEYEHGYARLTALSSWLQPRVVCFVGLTGYRAAANRRAAAGLQPDRLADAAVYVMPNTSGLNAHATPALLAEHFEAVRNLARQADGVGGRRSALD